MRRILRKIAEAAAEEAHSNKNPDQSRDSALLQNLGDTSTLADPGVVQELVRGREHL